MPRLEPTSSAMIRFVCFLPTTTGRGGRGRGNSWSRRCFTSNFPTPSHDDPLGGEEAGFNTVVVVVVAVVAAVVVVAADEEEGGIRIPQKAIESCTAMICSI